MEHMWDLGQCGVERLKGCAFVCVCMQEGEGPVADWARMCSGRFWANREHTHPAEIHCMRMNCQKSPDQVR